MASTAVAFSRGQYSCGLLHGQYSCGLVHGQYSCGLFTWPVQLWPFHMASTAVAFHMASTAVAFSRGQYSCGLSHGQYSCGLFTWPVQLWPFLMAGTAVVVLYETRMTAISLSLGQALVHFPQPVPVRAYPLNLTPFFTYKIRNGRKYSNVSKYLTDDYM